MTKTDLISEVAKNTGLTKADSKLAIDEAFACIGSELGDGCEVRIDKFGVFSVSHRAARDGRNPATGEVMRFAASKNVKFKASSVLKGEL